MNETHIPVLLHETIEGLNIQKDGIYLDLTLGRAGHSSEILKRLDKGLLIGIDQDEEAISESQKKLEAISPNFRIIRSNFSEIRKILTDLNIEEVDGVLMDIGVSSPQFDNAERGFTYKSDAPLDMRMDQRNTLTASKIVNTYTFEELCRVFRNYGDEQYAPNIADNIIAYRKNKPIETTFELVDIIKKSKPMKALAQEGHPAKQVFQALRIEVNDELNVLEKTIYDILPYLKKGGRLAVITFHSGEDKIVKRIFREKTVVEGNRYDLPTLSKEAEYCLVNNKPITASEQELAENHRSASAKLRIIERR